LDDTNDSSNIDGPAESSVGGTPKKVKTGLEGLHWRKRQKILAEMAKAEAEAQAQAQAVAEGGVKVESAEGEVNGDTTESQTAAASTPVSSIAVPPPSVEKARLKVEIAQESLPASASYWCVLDCSPAP
jgi:hypothetical protein